MLVSYLRHTIFSLARELLSSTLIRHDPMEILLSFVIHFFLYECSLRCLPDLHACYINIGLSVGPCLAWAYLVYKAYLVL
jgi:hypothetical protein